MFLGIEWGPWLDRLFACSTILTVAAGVLGFAQEHRTPEGELTTAGKALAILVIVAGFLTLVLGLADRKVAEEKDRQEDKERNQQFQSQMKELGHVTNSLGRVSGSLTYLQRNMRESLGTQRTLLGAADQNLRVGTALQRQTQANTVSVLRRLFEESNRIAAERIGISVTYGCTAEDPEENLPQLRSATLQIAGGSRRYITLSTTEKFVVAEGVIFHGFLGDLGPYESFSAWRNARVTIRLTARPTALGRELTIDSVQRWDELVKRLGRRPLPPVCRAAGALILNGRQVVATPSAIMQDRDGQWIAEFTGLRVDPRRLPIF